MLQALSYIEKKRTDLAVSEHKAVRRRKRSFPRRGKKQKEEFVVGLNPGILASVSPMPTKYYSHKLIRPLTTVGHHLNSRENAEVNPVLCLIIFLPEFCNVLDLFVIFGAHGPPRTAAGR